MLVPVLVFKFPLPVEEFMPFVVVAAPDADADADADTDADADVGPEVVPDDIPIPVPIGVEAGKSAMDLNLALYSFSSCSRR